MRILGIDHGEKRIGLAVGDTEFCVATPLKTIVAKNVVDELKKIVAEEKIEHLVLGLPLTLQGKRGHQAEAVEAFRRMLEQKLNIPVEFFDERMTTKIAKNAHAKDLDAAAASLLLHDWFQRKAHDGKS